MLLDVDKYILTVVVVSGFFAPQGISPGLIIAIFLMSAIELIAVVGVWIITYRGQLEMFRLSTHIARLVIQEGAKTREAIQSL